MPFIATLQAELYKESRSFTGSKIWSKRYFILSGLRLFYYKTLQSHARGEAPHKSLDIESCWIMDTGLIKAGKKVQQAPALAAPAPGSPAPSASAPLTALSTGLASNNGPSHRGCTR